MNGFAQNLSLTVHGNNQNETTILDSIGYAKNHKDFISIKTEVDRIQKTLFKIGYIENEVKRIEKINDSVFISKLNLKNKFRFIHIYYNEQHIDLETLNTISKNVNKDYFILKLNEVENTLQHINSVVSKKGFPFSKLKLSNISIKNDSTLKGDLTIAHPEKRRTIHDIIIKGYEKFPKSYLNHFLKIKRQQVFDLEKIKNKTQQLNNLTFANEIKSPEVLFSKDSTTLYIYLQKAQSNTFDGFLGFGTNEDTSRLEFDGYLNLNLINNLNYGEEFRLLYKSDENDQKTFETNMSLPYLFKTPIGVDLLLRIFKKDSSFTTINQSAKIHYQINSKNKKYLKPQINNALFPLRSKFFFETGFGKRKTKSDSEQQSQFNIDALKIFQLNNKNSLFFRGYGSRKIKFQILKKNCSDMVLALEFLQKQGY